MHRFAHNPRETGREEKATSTLVPLTPLFSLSLSFPFLFPLRRAATMGRPYSVSHFLCRDPRSSLSLEELVTGFVIVRGL